MRVIVGTEYVVEMVICDPSRRVSLAIRDDDGLAQVPADVFVTTDSRLPSNWTAELSETGYFQIGPRSWLRPDFWLDFWGSESSSRDATRQAVEDYRREREVILRESG